jgi:hypothetical protein
MRIDRSWNTNKLTTTLTMCGTHAAATKFILESNPKATTTSGKITIKQFANISGFRCST